MNRRGLIAMLHVARKQLGLDEDTYRSVLELATSKTSAAELTDRQLGVAVEAMKRLGFDPKRKAARSEKAHVRKVWALWAALEHAGKIRQPGRAACRAFVKRMTGLEDPEWLSPEQANKVVEALKAWERRPAAPEEA